MSRRIKIAGPIVKSPEEAETLLGEIAAASHQRDGYAADLRARLTAITAEYEELLGPLNKAIAEKATVLEAWAGTQEFEKGKKSREFLHGVIGFRTGTPKLKCLPKWNWDRVLDGLPPRFIRTAEEVDKAKLLADYGAGVLKDEELEALGCKVGQDESFFIDLKSKPVAATQLTVLSA